MRITKSPTLNSSAFRDAIFKLSATADEIIELDIYDHAGTQVIGRRRFYGTTAYDVNVANYAQGQFEIAPLKTVQCGFAVPTKRLINLTVRAGTVQGTTRLNAGIRTIFSYEKLSASPEIVAISPLESDELACICDGGNIQAVATLSGNTTTPVVLATKSSAEGLHVFCLKMTDVATKVRTAGLGEMADHDTMTVRILDSSGDEIACQRYQLVPNYTDSIRLCWWSTYGQIDYYSMRGAVNDGFEIQKERVYTADGYRITGSYRENHIELISDYVARDTMKWLSEIAISPGVWMEQNGTFVSVDVLTEKVTTSAEKLCQLNLTVRKSSREIFQHQ